MEKKTTMNEYSMVVVGLCLSFSDVIDAGLWRFDGVHTTIDNFVKFKYSS